jgi:hypothetical protein
MAVTGVNPDGSERTRLDQLPRVAMLTGWTTPISNDGRDSDYSTSNGQVILKLPGQAKLTGWGTPLTKAGARSPDFAEGREPNLQEGAVLAGWPTTTANDGKRGEDTNQFDRRHSPSLTGVVNMTGWPTPTSAEARAGARPPDAKRGPAPGMHETVRLTGWPTTSTMDSGNTGNAWEERRERVKANYPAGHNGFGMILPMAAQLAGSATMEGPARLTVSGQLLTGSDAGTKSGGQLSPAHSLWLMLGPFATAWVSCGERVTRSRSGKRKGSSAPSKR